MATVCVCAGLCAATVTCASARATRTGSSVSSVSRPSKARSCCAFAARSTTRTTSNATIASALADAVHFSLLSSLHPSLLYCLLFSSLRSTVNSSSLHCIIFHYNLHVQNTHYKLIIHVHMYTHFVCSGGRTGRDGTGH